MLLGETGYPQPRWDATVAQYGWKKN